MIRRAQLLEPGRRSTAPLRLATLAERVRDGLPRDNRIVPAVLGGLALLVFAWILAGAFVGDPGVQEDQQASNQASLAQDDSDSGGPETPAPGVENRDTDSYSEFGDPEDPFYPSSDVEDLFPKAGNGGGNGGNGGGNGNGGRNGGNGNRNTNGDEDANGDRDTNGGNGDRSGDRNTGDEGEDFIEQDSPPGQPDSPDEEPSDEEPPGGEPGGGPVPGPVPGQPPGQGGGLFNSGGDLPIP